jgi:hypothetical protein
MSYTAGKTMDTAAAVDEVLEWASRAPSVHNTQPWVWRVHGTRIDLYADFRRQLVYGDPQRRDLLISCGAALHHLQVAAAALGWKTRVRRTPDPTEERFVASIQLTPSPHPAEEDDTLSVLGKRITDRRRLSSWPVPADRLHSLAVTGSVWGAQVLPVEQQTTKALLERLTLRADLLQKRNPRYVEEMGAWTNASRRDGVPADHIPERDELEGPDALNRRFSHGALKDPLLDPEPSSDAMLLVCTSSDDPVSRIRAGESLSAVWLEATRENLSIVPLSQALEVEETRRTLQADVLGDLAVAQIVLRVGWLPLSLDGLKPTPRRSLEETRVRQ